MAQRAIKKGDASKFDRILNWGGILTNSKIYRRMLWHDVFSYLLDKENSDLQYAEARKMVRFLTNPDKDKDKYVLRTIYNFSFPILAEKKFDLFFEIHKSYPHSKLQNSYALINMAPYIPGNRYNNEVLVSERDFIDFIRKNDIDPLITTLDIMEGIREGSSQGLDHENISLWSTCLLDAPSHVLKEILDKSSRLPNASECKFFFTRNKPTDIFIIRDLLKNGLDIHAMLEDCYGDVLRDAEVDFSGDKAMELIGQINSTFHQDLIEAKKLIKAEKDREELQRELKDISAQRQQKHTSVPVSDFSLGIKSDIQEHDAIIYKSSAKKKKM